MFSLRGCLISDALPEGLTHELPSADEFETLPGTEDSDSFSIDDIENLRKQLDVLNST